MANLIVQKPITVSTSAYADGDCIGTGGVQTVEAPRVTKPSDKVVHAVHIADKAAQNAALTIVFFKANPGATTFTDNAALDIADADLFEICGEVAVTADDYVSFATNSCASVTAIGLPVDIDAEIVYFAIRCDGTPTYASASDLQVTINYL